MAHLRTAWWLVPSHGPTKLGFRCGRIIVGMKGVRLRLGLSHGVRCAWLGRYSSRNPALRSPSTMRAYSALKVGLSDQSAEAHFLTV
jgi:hypothetical protein